MTTNNAGNKASAGKWLLYLVAVIAVIAVLRGLLATRHEATATSHQDAATMKAVEDRIKPLGEVSIAATAPHAVAATTAVMPASAQPGAVATSAPSADEAKSAPAVAAAAPAASKSGESTYHSLCTGCHSIGAMGAPRYGDKTAWAPRIAQGMDALYRSALHGKNAMPAKGGNPALSDADVKAAVDYMVAAAR
ncbi:MAG: cytochrome c5 family protein [Betaproteobacteria bacterium]|nr:cytochrome c5 family protein [Betaproteobacteria bacterium]MDE2623063.1 cytochrome c5 family protein [Betaproteobacteria bacterium]